MIKNPLLDKREKTVYFGDRPLKEVAYLTEIIESEFSENVMIVGPFGKGLAQVFGFHENTYILYFLINPDDRPILKEMIQTEKLPIFPMRRPVYGAGTIDMFWKSNRKFTNKIAGAVQLITDDKRENLVITHMAVKPKWRRQGLNTLMIRIVEQEWPHNEIIFDEPTGEGLKFHKSYGRGILRGND